MILMEINWMNLRSFYGDRHLSFWDFIGHFVLVTGEQGGSFLFRQSFDSGGTIDNANGQLDVNSFTLTAWFKPGNGWGMIKDLEEKRGQMEWKQIIREIVNIECTCIMDIFWISYLLSARWFAHLLNHSKGCVVLLWFFVQPITILSMSLTITANK